MLTYLLTHNNALARQIVRQATKDAKISLDPPEKNAEERIKSEVLPKLRLTPGVLNFAVNKEGIIKRDGNKFWTAEGLPLETAAEVRAEIIAYLMIAASGKDKSFKRPGAWRKAEIRHNDDSLDRDLLDHCEDIALVLADITPGDPVPSYIADEIETDELRRYLEAAANTPRKRAIINLRMAGHNRTKVAEILHLDRQTIYRDLEAIKRDVERAKAADPYSGWFDCLLEDCNRK